MINMSALFKRIYIGLLVVVLPGAAILAQSAASLKTIRERGKKVYDTYCLSCHMEDGAGVPRLNPPLIKTSWVLGDKTKLITVVLKGLDAEVEIAGDYFSNVMAPHDFLTDQEIADVLSFVRTSFGNKAPHITAREVKKVRDAVVPKKPANQ